MFELFDPRQEYVVREGTLPHWYQPGVTYFVTFRTEDSVPQPLLRSWHLRRDQWLRAHGIDPTDAHWKIRLMATSELDREFHQQFTRAFMEYLDRGYGACPLRNPSVAKIVAGALLHFDGERYHLSDFVVMPNHVHLLVCLIGTTEIEAQCQSWKKYSAGQINRLLGRRGRFWQEESFDHLVRSGEQFEHFQRYIARNPEQARLRNSEYLHRVRPK
ncbi:MAG: transposase [Bythopirellula sp.]|nr:transposase [Bythopirellula sp.]